LDDLITVNICGTERFNYILAAQVQVPFVVRVPIALDHQVTQGVSEEVQDERYSDWNNVVADCARNVRAEVAEVGAEVADTTMEVVDGS